MRALARAALIGAATLSLGIGSASLSYADQFSHELSCSVGPHAASATLSVAAKNPQQTSVQHSYSIAGPHGSSAGHLRASKDDGLTLQHDSPRELIQPRPHPHPIEATFSAHCQTN